MPSFKNHHLTVQHLQEETKDNVRNYITKLYECLYGCSEMSCKQKHPNKSENVGVAHYVGMQHRYYKSYDKSGNNQTVLKQHSRARM